MPSSLQKRLLAGLLFLVVTVFGGTAGYYAIGLKADAPWTLWDCLYMTVITVTTVGFGETLVGMDQVEYARGFTMVLLLFGTGSIVFFASTVTAFIIEGDLRNVLFANKLKKRMRRMKDHIVVCGAGRTGENVIAELIKTGVPVIAIDTNETSLKELAEHNPNAAYSYIVGDATDDDVMAQANLAGARGLVAALSSDKDNLYIVFSSRQENPSLRIVARCIELSHVDKLKKSGADSVVSPNYIGGLRLVSEMVRPSVVRFLDEMLRDRRAAYRIEEITLGNGTSSLGGSLREARVRERFGMTVLALRAKGAEGWTYNPDAGESISPGMTLVVLGSADQVLQLKSATK
jgi:voltage-gated potassium channel